tara:strand:- start:66 stop:557 length:492 start_codon:yes stop_codon:yes gene_type:complete
MATTTPFRETILNNLVVDLQTIDVANSFRSNVSNDNITRSLKDPAEMDDDNFPALFVADGTENVTLLTNRQARGLFNIVIYGYVRFNKDAKTPIVASTQLNNLIADVKDIVLDSTSTFWTSTANIIARVTFVETDEGVLHPDAIFKMNVEVEYEHVGTDAGTA